MDGPEGLGGGADVGPDLHHSTGSAQGVPLLQTVPFIPRGIRNADP